MPQIPTHSTGKSLRAAIRDGRFDGQTAGQAPDYLQGNVVILPKAHAEDFLLYCLNNPKPCPLIGIAKPGQPSIPELGDIDIRTDVPRYKVFRHGEFDEELVDICPIWTSDLVTFVLGCSFTFEQALLSRGYAVRHISANQNVPMFCTNIDTVPGGVFSGPLVVTMRSYPAEQIASVFDISARYPHAHGSPIYWGDPFKLGIKDLQQPDFGDPIDVPPDEIPVFWACGVTPQAALAAAKPALSITHAPGCMLVTDLGSSTTPRLSPSMSDFSVD